MAKKKFKNVDLVQSAEFRFLKFLTVFFIILNPKIVPLNHLSTKYTRNYQKKVGF